MKHKGRSIGGLVAVVVAGAVLLSGCVTIDSETTIKADGSGSRSIIMTISKDMAAMATQGTGQSGQPQNPFADAETSASKIPGAKAEKYTDPTTGDQGVKITIPFKNLDELKAQQVGDKGESLDTINYSKAGNIITLNITVNTGDVAAGASNATGAMPSATQSSEDKALAAQMLSGMGFQFNYALALPGKILDWQPKERATYDSATNKITWNLDLTNSKMPDIVVKWDNSKAPEPIQAPAAPVVSSSMAAGGMASSVGADTLKKYAEAQMNNDQAAYTALFPGDQPLNHPLVEKYPQIFGASDFKVTYSTMVADAQTGAAQWTAKWTTNGKPQTLSGIDLLTFDGDGRITGIQSFVDPAQFVGLEGQK